MFDYTEAAQNNARVRLTDGEIYEIEYVPSGVDGWKVPVIRAWDIHDDPLHWDLNGTGLGHSDHIVEVMLIT